MPLSPAERCETNCESPNAEGWKKKCAWIVCRGCRQCYAWVNKVPDLQVQTRLWPAQRCARWCLSHKKPWAEKCAWGGCHGCKSCETPTISAGSPSRIRLAIATLIYADVRPQRNGWWKEALPGVYDEKAQNISRTAALCSIVKFCQQASILSDLPALHDQSEVVLLAGGAHAASYVNSECIAARKRILEIPKSLERIANTFVARAVTRPPKGSSWATFKSHAVPDQLARVALLKWQLVSLVEYEQIFFVDLDADLFGAGGDRGAWGWHVVRERLNAAWAFWLRRSLSTGAQLIAMPDHESPINSASRPFDHPVRA